MKYEDFLSIIMNYRKFQESLSELDDMGFNFFEGKYKLMGNVEAIFETSFKYVYNKDGIEWINWFIYENEYGQRDWSKIPSFKDGKLIEKDPIDSYGAKDKDGNPIAYSYESLYELLEKDYKLKE